MESIKAGLRNAETKVISSIAENPNTVLVNYRLINNGKSSEVKVATFKKNGRKWLCTIEEKKAKCGEQNAPAEPSLRP